ncbi:MAG: hypothetical protein GXP36_15475 [Actinobacteria bacterium]|nr:hypothetical protein [Actinomycetota bacterium]
MLLSDDPLRKYLVSVPHHTQAFAWLLELALRLTQARDMSGIARITSSLKNDRRLSSITHEQMMLEVGTLAYSLGASTRFEVGTPGHANPIDLVVEADSLYMPIEARVLFTDIQFRAAQADLDRLTEAWRHLQVTQNLNIDVDIDDCQQGVDRTLALLEGAAKEASASAREVEKSWSSGRIAVRPNKDGPEGQFKGPALVTDGWRRTRQTVLEKAAKDYGPRPPWLRIDVLDGLWQFTPWASYSLADKVQTVATQLRHDLEGHPTIAGLVLTSGAVLAQGTFLNETHTNQTSTDAGIRRLLPAGRVRETMIVPLRVGATSDVDFWLRMYDTEPRWLNAQLLHLGLPDISALFPGSVSPPAEE